MRKGSFIIPFMIVVLAMFVAVGVYAQRSGEERGPEGSVATEAGRPQEETAVKGYMEGGAVAEAGRPQEETAAKSQPEGAAAVAAGASVTTSPAQMARVEGAAGEGGSSSRKNFNPAQIPDGINLLYTFSGVSDDGQQGAAEREVATSIHCSNVGSSQATLAVEAWQWNGTDVYTATTTLAANQTRTFSTQNTAIYFDDVFIGGGSGTGAIFQGHGRILSSQEQVICTAQVLDARSLIPNFVSALELFRH